jgi:hypothetical protein
MQQFIRREGEEQFIRPKVRNARAKNAKVRNMKPIRILLASMPRMLLEMITQIIAKEPEFVIVGAIPECSDLTSAMRRSKVDLLIVGQLSLAEATNITAILSSSYPAKILTIAESGQCGALHELRPHCETIVDISAASLIAAIRTAIRPSKSKPNLQ